MYPPALYYALAHNRVPIVNHLTVTNLTAEAIQDLTVTVELAGPLGPLAPLWARHIAHLAAHGQLGWDEFDDLSPDVAALTELFESLQGNGTPSLSRISSIASTRSSAQCDSTAGSRPSVAIRNHTSSSKSAITTSSRRRSATYANTTEFAQAISRRSASRDGWGGEVPVAVVEALDGWFVGVPSRQDGVELDGPPRCERRRAGRTCASSRERDVGERLLRRRQLTRRAGQSS